MNRTDSSQHDITSDRIFLSVLRTVPNDLTVQVGTESQTRREPMVLRLPSQDGIRGRRMSILQLVLEQLEPLRKVACIALLLGLLSSSVFAQEDGTYVIGGEYSGSASSPNTPENPGVGGMGIVGRVGHEAGETIGRDESITTFDMSPFMFFEETMLFGEGRLFINNSGQAGGSAGIGLRHFFLEKNTIGGLEFFYDRDDSRGGDAFEQFGVSTEIFTEFLDIRGNYYLPFGKKETVLGTVFADGSEMFINNNIQFQTRTTTADALEGGDLMFTVPVPSEFAQSINLELSAGFYNYQARGKSQEQVFGYKLRGDIDLFERLSHMFLEVSNDDTFKTNVVFGADINYRGDQEARPRLGQSQYNRISQYVRRNRHVVARQSTTLNAPQLAINPRTGTPYVVYHVRNNPTPPPGNFPAPVGNGSIDTPFQFINEGIDAAPFGDIVFVHRNSVFDGNIVPNVNATAVLRENLLVLGEGTPLTIPTTGIINEIPVPTVPRFPGETAATNRPILRNITGPAVTMNNNSRFAGFTIENVDGPAILSVGRSNVELNEINITTTTGANGHGIQLTDNTGAFVLENINISSTFGDALQVTGGTANIIFEGTNTIIDPNGFAVFVQNAGGSVNLRDTSITADGTVSGTGNGGRGILVQGTPGFTSTANVTIGSASFTNTNQGMAANPAILIDNHSAGVSFLGDISIDTNNGNGIQIQELAPTGSVSFQGTTSVLNRNGIGVFIPSINEGPDPLNPGARRAGIVTFQDDLIINGTIAGNADPGLFYTSPSGQLNLVGNTTITTSGGTGFEVSGIANTGTVTGQILSSGLITINNTAGNAFQLNDVVKRRFQVDTNGIVVNNRAQTGIFINNYGGRTNLAGTNTIQNQFASTAPGIDIQTNTGVIGLGNTNVLNTVGPVGVIVNNNFSLDRALLLPNETLVQNQVGFSTLSVDGTAALGVQITNNRDVSTGGGVLDITNGQAIDVQNNGLDTLRINIGTVDEVVIPVVTRGHSLTFDEVSATNAAFGIRVLNSTGEFIVTGGNNFDGGTISGMTIAGALFQNTQVADLAFQTYNGNFIGIDANQMIQRVATPLPVLTQQPLPTNAGLTPFLRLDTVAINGSLSEGIRGLNVSTFSLLNSTLTNNGVANNQQQIQLLAGISEIDVDLDGDLDFANYTYTFDRNLITDGGAAAVGNDMILIQALAVIGDGAPLDLIFTNHGVTPNVVGIASNRAVASALNTQWIGDADILIQNNVFRLGAGTTQTGVELNIDGVADVIFDNNSLTAQGDFATGLEFAFTQQADVSVTNNFALDANDNLLNGSGFLFSGFDSNAMAFTFDGVGNNVFIDSNYIQFTRLQSDDTAILFRRIFGPSNVTISNNQVEYPQNFNNGFFVLSNQSGIIFQDVRGVINLDGANNIFNFDQNNAFVIDIQIPPNTFNGTIEINGNPRP